MQNIYFIVEDWFQIYNGKDNIANKLHKGRLQELEWKNPAVITFWKCENTDKSHTPSSATSENINSETFTSKLLENFEEMCSLFPVLHP